MLDRVARRKMFVDAHSATSVRNEPLVIIELADHKTCNLEKAISLKHEDAGEMVIRLLEVMASHDDELAESILNKYFRDDESDNYATNS